MSTKGWIGVDLDGTLAEYHGWVAADNIGQPVAWMVTKVRSWIDRGDDVRIFTARGSIDAADEALAYPAIEAWCLSHLGRILPITNRKDIHMISLYDDRAFRIEKNTGREAQSDLFFAMVAAEVARARTKFPSADHLTLALAEEAGEVVKAALDYSQGKGTDVELAKELVQAAAMCYRLFHDGDPTLGITGMEAQP